MRRVLNPQAVERVLFGLLIAALGVGGFIYRLWRSQMPGWQLPAMIVVGYCAAYLGYRLALRWTVGKRT